MGALSVSGDSVQSDLADGLSKRPLSIPSKYFYDDRGSALFDEICDLPEYYPTRTELALLEQTAAEIADLTQARELVELGSGTARKTGILIRALLRQHGQLRYVPIDISEFALEQASDSLRQRFPELEVQGVLCDYTGGLDPLDPGTECLAAFLGSTIGNFEHEQAVDLLARLQDKLDTSDWFLLGIDLVKPVEVLEAAYNDAGGVTEAFNKNILEVVNREAGGDFNPDDFEHRAIFNVDANQIEMYLRARRPVEATLADLDLELRIESGETILTEISRKFTRDSAEDMLVEAGFDPEQWFASNDNAFALALARARES